MESGSIAKWLLKEGDAFESGQAICEVETDKATVTYDATDDGYIAKILVGSGEIEVGAPLMVTVEDSSAVSAFSNYTVDSSSSSIARTSSVQTDEIASTTSGSGVILSALSTGEKSERVVASPLARRLAREANINLSQVATAKMPSGPHGRLLGADVSHVVSTGAISRLNSANIPSSVESTSSVTSSETRSNGVTTSFKPPDSSQSIPQLIGSLSSQSKREVPHYYLSVEINVRNIAALQESLVDNNISMQDILIKAAAKSMEKVPAVNAAWMDSFVRQYDQVDINLVMGEGSSLRAPVLRNVGARGLSDISQQVKSVYNNLEECSTDAETFECGTFTIHNLGMYGAHSAAAIVIPPQACALTFGAVVETVVPNLKPEGEQWQIAPVMVATLSCDHRVIDGAVGASWLKAFKEYAENPLTLLL
jgi:pyruvate dehydrogenase E2 component (dihydrolipoamide acetyltransferase)